MRKKNQGSIVYLPGAASYHAGMERQENVIGKAISAKRKAAGLTLDAFSERLKDFGVSVSKGGISKWETGETVPNAYQLIAICNALCIDSVLATFMREREVLLNDEGQEKVRSYMEDLILSGRYSPARKHEMPEAWVDMPISYMKVSAGTGAFMDEDSFETISFPASFVPQGAEFGVKVAGDSMEPVYHDGQIVWVQRCSELRDGEVGIFSYDGEGYLKAYHEDIPAAPDKDWPVDSYGRVLPQPVLVSYNPAYAPKSIKSGVPFQIVGRVL